jgi:two-component system, cell cycle sensor histidine kinase and response regulator CckA
MTPRTTLLNVRVFAPAAFRAWVLAGVSVAAAGYLLTTLLSIAQLGVNLVTAGIGGAATALCLVAVWLAWRDYVVQGALFVLLVAWGEVHGSFLIVTTFPAPGMLVPPVLIVGIGLLVGARWSLAATVVTIMTTIGTLRFSPSMAAHGLTDDSLFWFTLYSVVLFAAWVIATMTLSGFQRTFDLMQEQEQDLADAIRSAPDGILVVDASDRVLLANPAAAALLSQSAESLLQRPIGPLLQQVAPSASSADLLPRETDELPVPTLQIGTADTPRFAEVRWRRLRHGKRQLLLHDVTAKVEADAQQRALELRLSHAQRLEAVGQLAGGLAHDFNNILTAVGGSAELLRTAPNADEQGELVQDILDARDRGTMLTRQLLAFARRELIRPQIIDASTTTRSLLRLLQRVAGDRVPVTVHADTTCLVRVDPGQFEQALVNLVANARDAMPQGGDCTIAIAHHPSADGAAGVTIAVQDNGQGMGEEVLSRAFEPFFTTKPRGQGTGLGLASVHGMASQHAGTVRIVSTPGLGTTVTIELPLVAGVIESPISHTDIPAVATPRASVLVVDDDDATRTVVARMLRKAGFSVCEAPHGQAALDTFDEHPELVDLVLTDVVMPGLSGPALASALKARRPSLPVLFMTGYTDDDSMTSLERDTPNGVLAKPFSFQALINEVTRSLGDR